VKKVLVAVLLLGVAASLVMAQQVKSEQPKAGTTVEKPEPVELTVTGKLTKQENRYLLTDKDGNKIMLPPLKKDEAGNVVGVDYEKFVDKDVVVKGKGFVRTRKTEDGKEMKRTIFTSVTSIEEAQATTPAGEAK